MGIGPEHDPAGARSGRATGARHEGLAYSSPDELAFRLTPRVGAALHAGQPVTAVLDDACRVRLRAAMGAAADGAVTFLDPLQVHTVPAFTTALRWARHGGGAAADGPGPLVISQQLLDLPGCGPAYWRRLCAGLEVAAAGLALTVVCPFRDDVPGWGRVREAHRRLASRNGSGPNPAYRPPADVIRELPLPPPPDLGRPAAELTFRGTDLRALRRLTAGVAASGGLPSDRVADAVLAVNELASNTAEHGPGSGRLRLWVLERPAALLAEVSDHGRLADLFPGMVAPPTAGRRGRGMWLAGELSDVLETWTAHGTVIRLTWLR